MKFLRRFLAPSMHALETRQDALERTQAAQKGEWVAWELRMTELTSRLSSQLKRMAQLERSAQRRDTENLELADDDEGIDRMLADMKRRASGSN